MRRVSFTTHSYDASTYKWLSYDQKKKNAKHIQKVLHKYLNNEHIEKVAAHKQNW